MQLRNEKLTRFPAWICRVSDDKTYEEPFVKKASGEIVGLIELLAEAEKDIQIQY